MISYYHRRLQTACDENVITTNSLLPRPKNASDGLYELLMIGLNVVASDLGPLLPSVCEPEDAGFG